MDILKECERVIDEKDYILDNQNYYDIPTNTIHIKNEYFKNPIALYTLLHEIVHRSQIVDENKIQIDTKTLEREANDRALQAIGEMGRKTLRVVRYYERLMK